MKQILLLLFFGGVLTMTLPGGAGARGASPMQGPDFILGTIKEWKKPTGGSSTLVLSDGTQWHIPHEAGNYLELSNIVERQHTRGLPIFISGTKTTGAVNSVAMPRRLAANRLASSLRDGMLDVTFHGPPSIYHLRADRPWFKKAEELLRRSAASGAFIDTPDLLVSIDTVSNEIMDVRSLK